MRGETPRSAAAFLRLSQGSQPLLMADAPGSDGATERGHPLRGPAVAVTRLQVVAVQNAGDEIVVRERPAADGGNDVGRGAVALAAAPSREPQLGVARPPSGSAARFRRLASSRSATTSSITCARCASSTAHPSSVPSRRPRDPGRAAGRIGVEAMPAAERFRHAARSGARPRFAWASARFQRASSSRGHQAVLRIGGIVLSDARSAA